MKKLLVVLLVLGMLLPHMAFAKENHEIVTKISKAQYAAVDEMWLELLPRQTKGELPAEQVAEAVQDNALYREGTLRWNGEDHFTFETTEGVTCGYSERLYQISLQANAPVATEPEQESICYGESEQPTAHDVYLIEPYYGIDDSFTRQYQNEAKRIAAATGGNYHVYTKNAANIDAIADAMENGAVVLFDSHGDTDFARGSDYTSGATTSYLLLQTGEGLTQEDYKDDNGTYHAVNYGSAGGGMKLYAVDGTCIANHMEGSAKNGLLWMAICLGMATDGLHAPLREKGVEVVYGYSQSVTFMYDYLWEECFFEEMIGGATVADAIAKMKKEVGCWDEPDYYSTVQEAKRYRAAFPIVVSTQDVYPGHGNVDALQTVYSTWTLPPAAECQHKDTYVEQLEPTCTEAGSSRTICSNCGKVMEEVSYDALGHDYVLEVIAPTCEMIGCDLYTCSRCSDSYTENEVEALGHSFEDCLCVNCGAACVCAEFTDVSKENWFHDAAVHAIEYGWMNGVGDGKFAPDSSLTRAMLVTILYRIEGEPSVEGMEHPFADVKEDQWYTDAVIWAANCGIVNGTSETTFAPDQTITREQIATILYRYSGSPEVTQAELEFADAESVSDYALDAMRWAVGCGWINGMDGLLAPTQTATRAQTATILMRFFCAECRNCG